MKKKIESSDKISWSRQLWNLREEVSLALMIAWRNIFKHRGKSLIIGIILFIGAFLLTAGSAVLSGMNKGLQENVVNRFTGDIILIATNQKYESVIAGGGMQAVKPFASYTNVKRIMLSQKSVKGLLPACRGMAMVLNEQGDSGFTGLIGVDLAKYQEFFHTNLRVIEGSLPAEGEKVALASSGGRKEMYQGTGIWMIPDGGKVIESNLTPDALSNKDSLNVQSNVVLMGLSEGENSTDIRSPLKGIFEYKTLDSFWRDYSLLDLESFRECFGYNTASDAELKLSEDKKKILNMEDTNLDAMFSSTEMYGTENQAGNYNNISSLVKRKETNQVKMGDPELGTYNLVFVKLNKGYNLEQELKHINTVLSNEKASVKAVTWRTATSSIGDLANLIKWFLIIVEIFIYLVAVIIIMNTLSMAAIERTNEIGMMRAVGAGKGFIGEMFFSEIILLSGVFGGIGLVFGTLLSGIFDLLKLAAPTDNQFLALLFGGDYFHPVVDVMGFLMVIGLQILVTIVAMIYPIIVARKITPLEAISRD
jgi:ABC-type lipoprotein release transport system permease subunit